MLIGRLSELTGFSRDTIRFYEKIRLIRKPLRSVHMGPYKHYTDEDLEILRAIRRFKEFGFTLEEIRALLEMRSFRVVELTRLVEIVEYKMLGVDQEMERLRVLRARLGEEHQLLVHQKKSHLFDLPEMRSAA